MRRRLFRYILNALTLLSAVLCDAVVALWVASYPAVLAFPIPPGHDFHFYAHRGELYLWQASAGDFVFREDPCGFYVLLLAAAPLTRFVRLAVRVRREREGRRRRGQCVQCGYDLRATPRRCPECGMSTGAAGRAARDAFSAAAADALNRVR